LSSSAVAQVSTKNTSEIFNQLFLVFLVVGTLVGVVVIAYTLQKAYNYRSDDGETRENKPEPGELPPLEGSGKGKKLFLSFGASAVIVITLLGWTYFAGFVPMEQPPSEEQVEDQINVTVTGFQFGWEYMYTDDPNAEPELGRLTVPKDTVIKFEVTSRDVMHNFGIPEFDRRSDAIPGQTTNMWILPKETGTYEVRCYELCGTGHSNMNSQIEVVSKEEFAESNDWYDGGGQ